MCNEEFEVQYSLKQHVNDIHPEDLVPLSISRESEKHSVEKTKWNQLKVNENGRIDCLTCKKKFASFTNAKKHFREQHEAHQKFACVPCGKVFNYKRNMMRHNQMFHQNASLKYQLLVIDRVNVEFMDEKHEAIEGDHGISTKKQATKSIEKLEKIHGLPIENLEWKELKQNQDGQILCPNCHKSFASLHSVKRHFKEKHMSIERFQCEICQGSFVRKFSLMHHMRIVHSLPRARVVETFRNFQNQTSNMSNITKNRTVREHQTVCSKTSLVT